MFSRERGFRMSRAAFAAMCAGLVAAIATGHGTSGPPRTAEAAELQVVTPSSPAGPRPFDHLKHEELSCRSCHGTGANHRQLLVRTSRDCAACHHADESARSCTACHTESQIGAERLVRATFSLSVVDTPRTRLVSFGHERHLRAEYGLDCQECHRTPVTLAADRQCSSCHEKHHRPEATCSSCHTSIDQQVHTAETHLSCSAGGCHTPGVARIASTSRNLCLACHTDRGDHEPGRSCAGCHLIPTEAAADDIRRSGGAR
jgi:hypothetical protein